MDLDSTRGYLIKLRLKNICIPSETPRYYYTRFLFRPPLKKDYSFMTQPGLW